MIRQNLKQTPAVTREEWFARFVEHARVIFARVGFPLPERVRVSAGFPLGVSPRKNIWGQIFLPIHSMDEHNEVFVNPTLDKLDLASTLVHELVHAAVPSDTKHGSMFRSVGTLVGLSGKPKSMGARGNPELFLSVWGTVLTECGPYPAGCMTNLVAIKKPSPPGPVKLMCDAGCGCWLRTSRKFADAFGGMACPECDEGSMSV